MINVSNSDPTFYDAVQDINTFVSDPARRRVIEAIERDRRDRVDIRESGLREGFAEGFAKGEARGEARGRTAGLAEGREVERMAVASKMKRTGMDVASIAMVTGLSAEEIERLNLIPPLGRLKFRIRSHNPLFLTPRSLTFIYPSCTLDTVRESAGSRNTSFMHFHLGRV